MTQLAVAVLGPDRPGVIAALTEMLLADGGNLEDASMTVLRGQFAMTLVVDVPDSADRARSALAGVARELDLLVSVRETAGQPVTGGGRDAPEPFVLRVHGADAPGLLHRMAALLASHQVNITDLSTRLVGAAQAPVYVIVLSCEVPATAPRERLATEIAELARELGVESTWMPVDNDLL